MNSKNPILLTIPALLIVSSTVLASSNPNSEDVRADRARYQSLLREVRSVDSDYAKTLQQALNETKTNGEASLEIKSRLLSLTDKRDRLINRVTLIALRHGWEIPGSEPPGVNSAPVPDDRQRVFESADQMIRDRFASDARRIASKIKLPVVPIESVRQDERAAKRKAKKWLIF
jgi:hypothetical protein